MFSPVRHRGTKAEKRLLETFSTAALDGQRTIGRILYPIAGEETDLALTPQRNFTTLDAPRTVTAQLSVPGPVTVWLNGKEIFSRDAAGRQVEFPAEFAAGNNELRIKVTSIGGASLFSLRFCEPNGLAVQNRTFIAK